MMDLDYTQQGTRGPPRMSQSNRWAFACRRYIFGDVWFPAAFVAVIAYAAKSVWQF